MSLIHKTRVLLPLISKTVCPQLHIISIEHIREVSQSFLIREKKKKTFKNMTWPIKSEFEHCGFIFQWMSFRIPHDNYPSYSLNQYYQFTQKYSLIEILECYLLSILIFLSVPIFLSLTSIIIMVSIKQFHLSSLKQRLSYSCS